VRLSDFAATWADLPRGRTMETVQHNALMVKPFVRELGRLELGAVGREQAVDYVGRFPRHARYARTLMEDARREGLIDRNPFEGLRLPTSPGRRDIDVLDENQAWTLVDAVDRVYDGVFAVRFRALLATLAFSGIRGCGAYGLRAGDVDMETRPVTLSVVEKGQRDRQVVLAPARAVALLSEALAVSDGGLVFRNRQGNRLNRWSLRRALLPLVEESGLTFHQLRHFTASWMIDRGAAPVDVAIQLHGNTNPDTLARYYLHASRTESQKRLAEVCA
jgi:integrase